MLHLEAHFLRSPLSLSLCTQKICIVKDAVHSQMRFIHKKQVSIKSAFTVAVDVESALFARLIESIICVNIHQR